MKYIVEAENPNGVVDKMAKIQCGVLGDTISIQGFVESYKDYIFSIWVKLEQVDTITIMYPNGNQSFTFVGWLRLNVTINDATPKDLIYIVLPQNKDVYLYKAMLSIGNKLTDWCPASEDLEEYTDEQVTSAKSEFKQTAEEISATVSKKVGKDEIISSINQSAESVTIKASKINLNGVVTANEYFKILTDGSVRANAGKIGKWEIEKAGGLVSETSTGTTPGTLNRLFLQPMDINYYEDTWVMSCQHFDIDSSGNVSTLGHPYWYIKAGGDIYTVGDIKIEGQLVGNGNILKLSHKKDINSGIQLDNLRLKPVIDNDLALGGANNKWNTLYISSSSISTSDRNEKNSIENLTIETVKPLILGLNPVSYKFNNGTSDRTHYGMISQDVEDLMTELNMDSKDFAGFVKSPTDDGNYVYGLRYEEFIAPMIKMIQNQQEEIENLKNKIVNLEKILYNQNNNNV